MKSYDADVIVAGRGLVGVAAALGLAQQGLRVLNIAPAVPASAEVETTPWDRRVYALSAATLELLQRLRVRPLLQPNRVAPVRAMEISGDQGGRLTLSAYEAGLEQLASIVEARHLQQVLDSGCQMFPGLHSVVGRPSVCQDDGSRVRLTTEEGMTYQARLVIAADGANSPLRTSLGMTAKTHDYAQRGVVTHFVTQRPHQGTAFQWFLPQGILALLPMPEPDLVSMVYSLAEDEAQTLMAADPGELSAKVTRLSQNRLGTLQATDAPLAFPLRYLSSDRLIAPRVAFVGDAAHLMHPLAGQGLNAGLGDVAALLAIVSSAQTLGRDIGSTQLLRAYERSRAESLCLMLKTTDTLQRLFAQPAAPWKRLRNWGMNAVNRLPVVKKTLVAYASGS
ncbi:MAG: FAD-dependent monooxygenase [Burkholderiales bacterium]|jgi:ubiquinone biosynthesis UbiH/UbiF/VisC/COQ6 family hydroxylase|nr:FAD-dependent monooxygenase [Burkholderiales bacterium]MCA3157314.1 FAD-dependent monooxygenase [Burkholderiales bacterium]